MRVFAVRGTGNYPQTGGSGQFEVRASSSLCTWTAQSDAPWVTLRAGRTAGAPQPSSSRSRPPPGHAARQSPPPAFASASRRPPRPALQCQPGRVHRGRGRRRADCHRDDGALMRMECQQRAPWISLTSAAAGTGAGVATFSIAATSRRGGLGRCRRHSVAVDQGGRRAPPPPDTAPTPCSFANLRTSLPPVAEAGCRSRLGLAARGRPLVTPTG